MPPFVNSGSTKYFTQPCFSWRLIQTTPDKQTEFEWFRYWIHLCRIQCTYAYHSIAGDMKSLLKAKFKSSRKGVKLFCRACNRKMVYAWTCNRQSAHVQNLLWPCCCFYVALKPWLRQNRKVRQMWLCYCNYVALSLTDEEILHSSKKQNIHLEG